MEGIYFILTLCSFLNLASSHQAVKHLSKSDLAPYDSPHGPEQIHISYGNIPSEMTIMWSTSNSSEFASSVVLYGLAPKNYSLEAKGKCVLFTEGNPDGLKYMKCQFGRPLWLSAEELFSWSKGKMCFIYRRKSRWTEIHPSRCSPGKSHRSVLKQWWLDSQSIDHGT